MTTQLSITSRNQGQIFGEKPSMEEFERQLAADPAFLAYGRVCARLNQMGAFIGATLQRLQAAKDASSINLNTTQLSAK